MTAPLLDLALSRRIELAEAQAAVDAAETMERLRPGSGSAVEPILGGFAVYCGANSPVTQAVGLGLDGAVGEEEFARLEAFYRGRNEPVRVESSPLADSSLFEQFGKHGYRVTEFTNVMARTLCPRDLAAVPASRASRVTCQKIAREQVDSWTLTVSEGFAESHPVTAELLEVMKMFACAPKVECYLAHLDGQIAGGATLIIRDGVAGLFGASTLAAYRGRGVQTALLETRLARALDANCDLAVCLARPGSSSERNVMRQGFQALYTRVKFERAWR